MRSPIDLAIVVAYLVGVVLFGAWFLRRNRDPERFMAAGRSVPGWAVGLTMFGSYVSSISFLALPGKSFGGDWNAFVFSLSLPLTAWIAVRWFVPFYRQAGEVSSYHHLEHRFGPWARTYAVVCYLLTQLVRTGTVMYLLALALTALLDVNLTAIILVLGVIMTIYPVLGGTEAVIWTGVVQTVLLIVGALVCFVWLTFGGHGDVIATGLAHHKFSLGSWGTSLAQPTVWVVFFYGIAENLKNFGISQNYVQLYITAKSERAAKQSVWIAAAMYIPISAVFFFIGTALFAFYQNGGAVLPAGLKDDKVFPYFIGTQLPVGLTGLVIAAVCAAATDSNFNAMATLIHCDLYRRYWRPDCSDREGMHVLRFSVVVCGAVSTIVALAMTEVKSVLDAWWAMAGIFSGGMLGLFLLGILSRRAGNLAAAIGTTVGVLVILWMSLSVKNPVWMFPPAWQSGMHEFLVPVMGTMAILFIGLLVGRLARTAATASR